MNILESLEAGLYPKNENGHQVVPTRARETATIYTWHHPDRLCIVGFVEGFIRTWDKNGAQLEYETPYDLMPVKTKYACNTCFVIDNETGKVVYFCTDSDWDEITLSKYRGQPRYSLVYRIMEGEVPV